MESVKIVPNDGNEEQETGVNDEEENDDEKRMKKVRFSLRIGGGVLIARFSAAPLIARTGPKGCTNGGRDGFGGIQGLFTKTETAVLIYGFLGLILSTLAITDNVMLLGFGVSTIQLCPEDDVEEYVYDFNDLASMSWPGAFHYFFTQRVPPILLAISLMTFYYSVVLLAGIYMEDVKRLKKYYRYGLIACLVSISFGYISEVNVSQYGFRYIPSCDMTRTVAYGLFNIFFAGGMLLSMKVQKQYTKLDLINGSLQTEDEPKN